MFLVSQISASKHVAAAEFATFAKNSTSAASSVSASVLTAVLGEASFRVALLQRATEESREALVAAGATEQHAVVKTLVESAVRVLAIQRAVEVSRDGLAAAASVDQAGQRVAMFLVSKISASKHVAAA